MCQSHQVWDSPLKSTSRGLTVQCDTATSETRTRRFLAVMVRALVLLRDGPQSLGIRASDGRGRAVLNAAREDVA
jgi:hypothetical protein